jgi:hypothetical protein
MRGMMDPELRVCPFCGAEPGAGVFCAACGRNLSAVDRLPTRSAWEAAAPDDAPDADLPERCAAATAAFLAAMHAAGDPGAEDLLPGYGLLRRRRAPRAWVVRPVHREPDGDLHAYEPGLVLTVEGRFHALESEVRGYGQRNFPRFADTPAGEPLDPPPADPRLPAELAALLREHGVEG